jgi:hypothetical protein
MTTVFPGLTTAQVLLYTLKRARECLDQEKYVSATSYMKDVQIASRELNDIAVFGV